MKVTKLSDLSKKDYERIVRRSFGTNLSIMPNVKKIIRDVKTNGDSVIINNCQKNYGIQNLDNLQVTQSEVKNAYSQVDKTTIQALRQMIKNITLVHKAQLPRKKDTIVQTEKGIRVWREWRAIEKVGLYVPGGKAIYPSSILMSAIPAQIAGCRDIILCSPAKQDGNMSAATIIAADLIGLRKLYKVGGIEAIAAMAYGTETIPCVYKIFGAGNAYVTAAKMYVFGDVAIDMPAGPSEIFIIADKEANPKFIAADLLADGEHGTDSACVLITTSQQIAKESIKQIEKQLQSLRTRDRIEESIKRYGLFAIVNSLDEAVSFANEYAPEHLEIMTKNPEKLVEKITNAGSIFLGDWTSKATGDYATGANHVLPTGGTAKMYSPLGVDAYGKWMQVQECTKDGLMAIKKTIETIAEVEQLPAHKNSISVRFA
ncbi:histidinol dehydrogenase [Candidatus Roizmanbacteria bacterium RIFCSPHIGHO2_02_FULL_37_13b]|uniref:Histidinol dehydrogenase n=1 Tax=Candidatus Roizmanbacteria bacterium RIFCSPLOWO2_02_FULL_36_11 TaxID=1802071 RepID=A0A1F7JCE8_9BACT|nr:MAG: histidinol dehydrogenase [Candidatus Roizmanbacteria bacterium RIFCSPHIGHO2_02_FULL_37_13b]OGK53279.1 MAG: histidinol dehydrogenase [Candidatus Roizmanbacteria bacterium RIFCSPLOWO2_02_FULL_36_11]